MNAESLQLANGDRIPAVGLGLWKIPPSDAPRVVVEAVRRGYRHLDSASDYGNEPEVGAGLQAVFDQGLCRRENLWVTSKLWNTNHAAEHVRPALERTLSDLRLDHLDLYLIHFPISQRFVPPAVRYPAGWFYDASASQPRMEFQAVPIHETWQAMEEVRAAGLTRNIGVCNFSTALLRDLLTYAEVRPAVLQVELHPLLTQDKLVRFCHSEQISVTAFSPLGSPSYVPLGMAHADESLLEHPLIMKIAAAHGKTAAQVLLRWGVQRGTAVIPKTLQPQRLSENIDVFDFALAEEDMHAISGLNRNRRFNDPGVFCEAAFNTFCPIYD